MKIKLNIRKTLDNNLVIKDHPKLLIFISPGSKKILTLPKTDKIDEEIFLASKKLFDFLIEKGLVEPTSVKGGALYKSMESNYPESDEIKSLNAILKCLDEFIDIENKYYEASVGPDEEFEEDLTDPSEEDSTELGEIPQKPEDGSMPRYHPLYSDSWYGYMF